MPSISDSVNDSDIDISDADLFHLGHLTCLHIDDTDTDNSKDDSTSHITIKRSISTSSLRHDVKQMIQWMSQIKSIATDGIQPIYTPLQIIESTNTKHYAIGTHSNSDTQDDTKHHPSMLHPHNKSSERYRHDIATEGNMQRDVLSNASHTDRGFIVVPKVINSHVDSES
jgi:Asp-tRNA(Asn)/Glu-tRNA(Gln) amidotransferase C subunit